MSVGPGTHTALIQGNQSTAGPDPSQHSALFYLFQEVSKLASPIHNTFVDTDLPCPWLKDASLQGSFIEEREMCSFEISDHSGSPHESSLNQTDVMDQSQDSKTTPESHSPWKVLSLINLQCKQLLHHSDAEEYGPNSLLSSSLLTIDQLPKAAAKVSDREAGSDCSSSALSFRPSVLKYEREEIASCVSADEAIIGTGVGSNPQLCVEDSREDSRQSESTGKPETANDLSDFHHEEKKEDKFSTNRQSEWNNEQAEEYLSSEEGTGRFTSENESKETKPTPNEVLNNHLTYGLNFEADRLLMKPEFTFDCNANVSLPIEATRDPHLESLHVSQPSSPSAAHPWIITDQGHPLAEHGVSHQEVTGALLVQQTSNTQTNPPNCVESNLELGPGQKEDDAAGAAAQLWRTKTPRKQPRPSRSVNIHDPDLQGVMFRMDPELDDSKEQCRLLITSEYRGCCNSLSTHRPGPSSKRVRKARSRMRASQKSVTTSSSDDETSSVSKDKICASCCTRKTPMWRNAEDGTPLCNACGIRYKKYRVRCVNCWHIPRKESNSSSTCLKCGNFVRLTSAQLKHTT